MNPALPEPTKLELLLHTAVDRVKGQGVGIGVLQQGRCATTGVLMPYVLPTEEHRYGIRRAYFPIENVKTRERAEMLALLHALGLASSTVKKRCPPAMELQHINFFLRTSIGHIYCQASPRTLSGEPCGRGERKRPRHDQEGCSSDKEI